MDRKHLKTLTRGKNMERNAMINKHFNLGVNRKLFIKLISIFIGIQSTAALAMQEDEIRQIIREEIEFKKGSEVTYDISSYFRAGSNMLLSGGAKNGGSCFSLNYPKNDGYFYRLGNECRDYAEFGFVRKAPGFNIHWRFDIAGDSRDPGRVEPWSRRSKQLYIESMNAFDNGTLWIGRRFYRAIGGIGDYHLIDAFHMQSSGNGVGVSDIKIGDNNKLYLALMGYGNEGTLEGSEGVGAENFQSYMFDGRYQINTASGDQWVLGLQNLFIFDTGDNVGIEGGYSLTVQWAKDFANYNQRTTLQYGANAMAKNPACFGTDGGPDSPCFDFTQDDSTGYRLIHGGTITVNDRLLLRTHALYQDSEDYHTLASLGVRTHYKMNDLWSVLFEVANSEYEKVNLDAQDLTQVTLALQVTPYASDFWARPSLRFYVSNFSWNDAATAQSGLTVPGEDPDETSAAILGVQAEVWF